ncbi:MAG: glycosyltransferase [Anaerolineae bacterium]|nr:glycosyltransferase [Anaerolineae bacterium]
MKIVLLHYAAPPVIGGVESVMGHHANLLHQAGYQVLILAGRGEQVDENIPFMSIPLLDSRHPDILKAKAALDQGIMPAEFDRLTATISESLRKMLSPSDVLIAHNVCSLNKNLMLTAAIKNLMQKPGAPRLILWHHDLAWTTPRYINELHDAYPWNLLKNDWPEAIQVTISRSRQVELAQLLNVPEERIKVISNGVNINAFLKLERLTRQWVKKLKLLTASPLMLLPVRITPRKNIELAIRTLAELRKTMPDATLVVTGPLGAHNPANTSYFESLTQLRAELHLEENFLFLAEQSEEYLPDSVIADFYQLADLLFLPSREEGFGIPILEAGLAGLPIFCADIAPLRDIGGEYATYFSPETEPQTLAAEISRQLSVDKIFNLRRRVKQEFTWDQIFSEQIQPLLSDREE